MSTRQAPLYINNTKIAREIRYGIEFGDHEYLYSNSKDIKLYYTISCDDDSITHCDYIDMMIVDAVYSLIRSNRTRITEAMILRTLSGDPKQCCRQEMKLEIRKRLNRLSKINIDIFCDDEMVDRGLEYEEGSFDGPLLPFEDNGNGAYLVEYLPMYGYMEKVSQMILIPTALLNLTVDGHKAVPDSLKNLALKHYLLQRIHYAFYQLNNNANPTDLMKGINASTIYYYRKPHEKNAKYKGMLIDLGLATPDMAPSELNKRKNLIHKNVVRILDALKSLNYIGGYSFKKGNDNQIIGIEFTKGSKKYIATP